MHLLNRVIFLEGDIMNWNICFFISLIVLICSVMGSIIMSKSRYRRSIIFQPSNFLFVGVVISATILFFPIYANTFKNSRCGILETILIAIHNTIRLFIVDGEFDFITSNINELPDWLARAYTSLFSVLFVLAPILTFGFVLSFFKNILAYKKYITHFYSDAYIFSELNEKSIALAKSLSKNKSKHRLFVFTDVFSNEEEECYELIDQAKEIGAICFKKDIVAIDFSFHSKKRMLNFFAIGRDESENLSQAIKLITNRKYGTNTNLYVFSSQVESELLLTHAFGRSEKSGIKVRRINDVQSLILRTLYDSGYEKLFKTAYDSGKKNKEINAIVLGMGQHGTEMIKALSWCCQMDGYNISINSFELDEQADTKFKAQCPELMDETHNGKFNSDGDANYLINIHSNCDITTYEFETEISSLPRTTYVFIALGNDSLNITTAIKVRTFFERLGYEPAIQAIVSNTEKKMALDDIKNFKGQNYNIDFIGDIQSSYSEKVILDLDVENEALKRHLKWGSEEEFWQYNYNYKSSVASAIHRKLKFECGIKGIDKKTSDRNNDELWAIRKLEHRRWNAYMRSEGYVYGGTVENRGRNDLAKTHNCLVPFDELPLKDQEKDDD